MGWPTHEPHRAPLEHYDPAAGVAPLHGGLEHVFLFTKLTPIPPTPYRRELVELLSAGRDLVDIERYFKGAPYNMGQGDIQALLQSEGLAPPHREA